LGILFGLFTLGAQPFAADLIPSPWDHLLHLLVFAVLATAVGILTGQRGGRMVLLAVAGALLIGVLDEWHQVFLPGRHPGWDDLAMDALGSLSGASLLALARRRDVRTAGLASPADDEPVTPR
jgi:VanZ family protein